MMTSSEGDQMTDFQNLTQRRRRRRPRDPLVPCPHCGDYAYIRSSESAGPTYREAVYECDNAACGFKFIVGISIIRTLVPSARPRSDIDLPMARPRARPGNDNDSPEYPPPARAALAPG